MGHKPIITPAKQLEQARAEARRRWGVKGWAWHPHYAFKGGDSYCAVGVKEHGDNEHQWVVYGIGRDFGEAFKDSEERGHG